MKELVQLLGDDGLLDPARQLEVARGIGAALAPPGWRRRMYQVWAHLAGVRLSDAELDQVGPPDSGPGGGEDA